MTSQNNENEYRSLPSNMKSKAAGLNGLDQSKSSSKLKRKVIQILEYHYRLQTNICRAQGVYIDEKKTLLAEHLRFGSELGTRLGPTASALTPSCSLSCSFFYFLLPPTRLVSLSDPTNSRTASRKPSSGKRQGEILCEILLITISRM